MKSLLFLLTAAALAAEPSVLDRPVGYLRLEKAPLDAALRTVARGCQTNVLIDPDITVRSRLTSTRAPCVPR